MKTSDLFNNVKFKNVFNIVYKKYYKNQKLPEHKIIELSLLYRDLFNKLKSDNSDIEESMPQEELSAHILYYYNR